MWFVSEGGLDAGALECMDRKDGMFVLGHVVHLMDDSVDGGALCSKYDGKVAHDCADFLGACAILHVYVAVADVDQIVVSIVDVERAAAIESKPFWRVEFGCPFRG